MKAAPVRGGFFVLVGKMYLDIAKLSEHFKHPLVYWGASIFVSIHAVYFGYLLNIPSEIREFLGLQFYAALQSEIVQSIFYSGVISGVFVLILHFLDTFSTVLKYRKISWRRFHRLIIKSPVKLNMGLTLSIFPLFYTADPYGLVGLVILFAVLIRDMEFKMIEFQTVCIDWFLLILDKNLKKRRRKNLEINRELLRYKELLDRGERVLSVKLRYQQIRLFINDVRSGFFDFSFKIARSANKKNKLRLKIYKMNNGGRSSVITYPLAVLVFVAAGALKLSGELKEYLLIENSNGELLELSFIGPAENDLLLFFDGEDFVLLPSTNLSKISSSPITSPEES